MIQLISLQLKSLLPALAILVLMSGQAVSEGPAPEPYNVANTTTLSRSTNGIEIVPTNFEQRLVHIAMSDDERELLIDAGAVLRLWRIPTGLSQIEWPVSAGVSLSRADAVVLAGVETADLVPTWGAEVDWPGLGPVTLIVFRMGPERFGGLLSSTPSGVKRLRQMVFQRASSHGRQRPRSRPAEPCSAC
ncbi:hypothetical protein [Stappia sp. ES.058]|uniref:hypothetical protein n=1 Tax=Stappia sp. ES.058 TaxID=1881061 RepID=UPI00087A8753|nr:hypothetical protein [Stappia sp. ES.058]SDU20153.1 hypothetical protein SAMN05428979_2245 [Stappia sp. ES.058]